ncbi:MAG: DUF1749 domain-containing protein, partial [Candidatus Paceibacterota bacterium]
KGVSHIILLGPMNGYASEIKSQGKAALKKAERYARAFIKQGNKHALLPETVWGWPWTADAQRFISLYSGNSEEEIFTYWDEGRTPRALRSVKVPILVLLAEKDEYADRSAKKMGEWFMKWLYMGHVVVIPKVKHSFHGAEKEVARVIKSFMKDSS